MIYPHAFGPAGLPFELLGLLDWLGAGLQDDEMSVLRACSGLDLPVDRAALASTGLPAAAIQAEIALGKQMGVTTLLAGLALVDLPGINAAHPDDLPASLSADGIVLSWDLWHIAPDVLHRLAELLKEA
jgi:hypothetical protein